MNAPHTLASLAAAAGASQKTALRALRGAPFVAPAVAAAVLAQAAPCDHARLLEGAATAARRPVVVHVSQFESSTIHELATTIGAELRRAGYEMLLYSAIGQAEDFHGGACAALHALCEGVILVMPWMTPGFLRQLEAAHMPAVLVEYSAETTTLPAVMADNRGGAFKVVEAMLGAGHRRIAFVGGAPHTGQGAAREAGYRDALAAAGMQAHDDYVVPGDFTFASGVQAAKRLLDLAEPPTAIFAANDEMALGVIDAVQARGLLVPDEISVAGFDDILAASYVTPTLTTVRTPLKAMSHEAVRRIVDAIEGRARGHGRTEFATKLVQRGSTGPMIWPA